MGGIMTLKEEAEILIQTQLWDRDLGVKQA